MDQTSLMNLLTRYPIMQVDNLTGTQTHKERTTIWITTSWTKNLKMSKKDEQTNGTSWKKFLTVGGPYRKSI